MHQSLEKYYSDAGLYRDGRGLGARCEGNESMSYLWLTAVMSVFYLFDSAMMPFAQSIVHMNFFMLTATYVSSVAELSIMITLVRRRIGRKRRHTAKSI